MKSIQRGKSEAIADSFFDPSLTARERAIFEGAITLGALYHQFVGVPVSRDRRVLDILERAISETMSLQPYKERVSVHIRDSSMKQGKGDPYGYSELEGKMLEAEVVSQYRGYRATLALRFVPELKYNLMFVRHLERAGSHGGGRSRAGKT